MTYKEFVYRELGDDVTPEEAKRAYDQYLTEFWGSQIRAQFEAHRNDAWYALPHFDLCMDCFIRRIYRLILVVRLMLWGPCVSWTLRLMKGSNYLLFTVFIVHSCSRLN
jgi:hypothetical protein